ncbi:MAG TPA: thiamine pyrophosphate-binding protein [Thermoanaerobaculia bacterium]|jgi:benzoylformate decarboxylase|nr:thiamine pyrophosphate-binding protein [Thermoanaerobaculia bacterium]
MTVSPDNGRRWVRDYVFDALKDLGIHYIFGVPGTNEIPIIDGTDVPSNDVTYIECLHENIAIGAAIGSARMTGLPGIMLCHITPGIAHAIGNLYNAWRSRVPLIVLCAQQQNELVTQEPLLESDVVEIAQQFTKWAHEVRAPEEVPLVLQRAFKEAMAPPTGAVFISFPWEFMAREIGPEDRLPGITRISQHFTGDPEAIRAAADALAGAQNPIIVAGDAVGYAGAWPELQELAELIGAPVVMQSLSSVANFPNDDVHWQGELPTSQSGTQAVFAEHDVAFLVGWGPQAQVTVFKYSDGPLIPATVKQVYLTNNTWDIGKNHFGEVAVFGGVKATLPEINRLIAENPPPGAAARNETMRKLAVTRAQNWAQYIETASQQQEIWAVLVADALRKTIDSRGLQKQFVYVQEAISDQAPFQFLLPLGTASAEPISYYSLAGGSLGWSMPATIGIKLEEKGYQGIDTRLVVAATGDGSALFYTQTWWTAAHRKLPVLYIITNNREYHTLQLGLQTIISVYGNAPGYMWNPVTDNPSYLFIEHPDVDFLALAKSFGIANGARVTEPAQVLAAVEAAVDHVLRENSSYVLDVRQAQNPRATPSTADTQAATGPTGVPHAMWSQPPLDIYHHRGKQPEYDGVPANVPLIF